MSERSEQFNLADIWETVADAVPDRIALVCEGRRLTYRELDERSTRLAHWLQEQGVQPGQHIGCYLYNGIEYVEAMLAAWKIRAVPINVNYRYVADELRYLFNDADLVGIVHHRAFVPQVADVRGDCPKLGWALTVDDDTTAGLAEVDGVPYEDALAAASPGRDFGPRSGDDRYVIYTGGTTGMPKGVVWRSDDAFFACMGGGDPTRVLGDVTSVAEVRERILEGQVVFLPTAPLMHAAGGWTVFIWLFGGGRCILIPGSFDPVEIWRTIEREKVNSISVVGDAMLRPLLDAWDEHGPFDYSSITTIGSGGAPLSPAVRDRFLATFPDLALNDGYGSSETGIQAARRFTAGASGPEPQFMASQAVVLDEEAHRPVEPGSGKVGRVARTGRIPLEYYNDPEKTASTFVEWDGRRWSLTGDMATVEPDGTISLLGRGSLCINTGGEKVYPEEVEAVLKANTKVYDVLVCGAPDERWGQRVVAVVEPTPGTQPTEDELRQHCRASLAGYKVPKQVVLVDHVVRSPTGKADYRWAADVAASAAAS